MIPGIDPLSVTTNRILPITIRSTHYKNIHELYEDADQNPEEFGRVILELIKKYN